jgi:hypothetical protein
MKADYLAFRNAEKLVQSYAHEWRDLVAQQTSVADSRNGEALLQMGIDAFEWLLRADRAMRSAICGGQTLFDPEFETALRGLCQGWLETGQRANQWIAKQPQLSREVDNLAKFHHCLEEMAAILEADHANDTLSAPLADLRDRAVDEQRHGTTAEFI